MEHRKIIRSAFLVGFLTSVSRVFGLVRDFLTAGYFGTTLAMSAFVVAFRIPNLFRALFGEGALASAFVPVFVESRQREGETAAWQLATKVISLVVLVLVAIVALGILLISASLYVLTPGPKTEMILRLLRIMLPYMIFICLAALAQAILNSFRKFALPALTPALLNITWIAAILLVCPFVPGPLERKIFGLAWGIFAAGVIQLGVQWPALLRAGYRPRFHLDLRDQRVWKVFLLMGPAALGLAVYQVNAAVDSLLASWIGTWAPAALFYSERLLYFPQGLLATAMSTVLLPTFSHHTARQDFEGMRQTINNSLRALMFVMWPAATGLLVLAVPIIRMIYEWNRFDTTSTVLTARALWLYAPGLIVFGLAKVFVPAFYALQDTRTPIRIGLACVALNFTLNVTFILTFPTYWKHAGLALATVVSEGINGLVLAFFIHKRIGSPGWSRIIRSLCRIAVAAVSMGIAVLGIERLFWHGLAAVLPHPKLTQITSVMGAIACGIVLYAVLTRILGCPEWHEIRAAFQTKRKMESPAPTISES